MDAEYLERIRASITEEPVGAYASDLLAEVDRLRTAAATLAAELRQRADDAARQLQDSESPTSHDRDVGLRVALGCSAQAFTRGRELGLFADEAP